MSVPVRILAEFDPPSIFNPYTFGNNNPAYVDITNLGVSFSVDRGRADYTRPFDAGRCSVTFRNLNGVLDPENTSSPYYPAVQVGRRINIAYAPPTTALEAGVFVGFITDIIYSYSLDGDALVTIQAADVMSIHSQQDLEPFSFPEQTTAERFLAVLNRPEVYNPWPFTPIIEGFSICAAATGEGNVLQYMQEIALTEQGAIFADRNGFLQFKNRYELLQAPTQTFSDSGSNIDYEALERGLTTTELYNKLQASRPNQTPVIREKSSSETLFGVRFLNLGDTLFNSDAEVTDMLDFALVRYASSLPRIKRVTTLLDGKSESVISAICNLDLSSSVTVEFTPPGAPAITTPCTIEAIRHNYTVGQGWRVEFGFTPRDTSNYLKLNDATLGKLDQNVLAF